MALARAGVTGHCLLTWGALPKGGLASGRIWDTLNTVHSVWKYPKPSSKLGQLSGSRVPFLSPHMQFGLNYLNISTESPFPSHNNFLFLYFIPYISNPSLYNPHTGLHKGKYNFPGRSEFDPDMDMVSQHSPALKSRDAGRGLGIWQKLSSTRQEGNSPVACLLLSQGVLTGLRMGKERGDVLFQPRKEWQLCSTVQ